MKKFVCILLILLLSHQLVLSIFVFKIAQLQVKNKISGLIQQKKVDVIYLSIPFSELNDPNLFNWEEYQKEFTYRRQWYDIVSYEIKEGAVEFECHLDNEERKMVENFKNRHSSIENFFAFFSTDFISWLFIMIFPMIDHLMGFYYDMYICHFPIISLPLLSPPPRVID